MTNIVPLFRSNVLEIVVRRHPAWGGFLVTMPDDGSEHGEYNEAYATAEGAFVAAERLKRYFGPAAIRDRTGGAS